MADFPSRALCPSPIVMPWSDECLGRHLIAITLDFNTAASSAWPVNNQAFLFPFRLETPARAYQLLFMVGAASSGNIDVGIYDSQKNLIVSSGSTAMSATVNTVQELNIDDTLLPPGDYLLAVACSTTGGTGFAINAGDEVLLPALPVYMQATALPLPNPCVPILSTAASVNVFVCGIQFRPVF